MDRLAIPIEHRDVDLNDVRGGAEDGHLLRVPGRDGADRESGDDEKDCVGLSHRLSPDGVWILPVPRDPSHSDGANRNPPTSPCRVETIPRVLMNQVDAYQMPWTRRQTRIVQSTTVHPSTIAAVSGSALIIATLLAKSGTAIAATAISAIVVDRSTT